MSVVTRIRTSEQLTVPFTPEQVWMVLVDVAAYANWWPPNLGVRVLYEPGVLVGTEFEVRPFLGRAYCCRFEEFEEPFHMRIRYFGGTLEGPGGFDLEPIGDSTRIHYEMDVFARGLDVAMLSQVVPLERVHAARLKSVLRSLANRLQSDRAAALKASDATARMATEQAAQRAAEVAAAQRAVEETAARRVAEEAAELRAREIEAARIAAEQARTTREAAELAVLQAADQEAARVARAAEQAAELRAREIEAARIAAEQARVMREAAELAVLQAADQEAARVARAAEQAAELRAREIEAARIAAEQARVTREAAELAVLQAAEQEAARVARAAEEAAELRVREIEAARIAAEQARATREAAELAVLQAAEQEAARVAAEEVAARDIEALARPTSPITPLPASPRSVRGVLGSLQDWRFEPPPVNPPLEAAQTGANVPTTTSQSNFDRAREYLEALSSPAPPEVIAECFAAAAIQEEWPHRFLSRAVARDRGEIIAARARDLSLLRAQGFELRGATGGGTQVAMEILWTASLAQDTDGVPAGPEFEARMAIFLKFEEGRILRQRTYSCFERWPDHDQRGQTLPERTRPKAALPVSPGDRKAFPRPSGSHFDIARSYLDALSSRAAADAVAAYYAPDAVQEEFPNRLRPEGAWRNLDDIKAARNEGLTLFSEEHYELRGATGGGSQVAMEIHWRAVVAKTSEGNLEAGQRLQARLAVFLKFRDGLIVRQRNYPCA